jgi:hypothetical protein
VALELPLPTATGACPAPPVLPEPVTLTVTRHFTNGCSRQIAGDAAGALLFEDVESLGGGGYWYSRVAAFAPDGSAAPGGPAWQRVVVGAERGFVSYAAGDQVAAGGGLAPWSAGVIPWPVQLGMPYWPAAYSGELAAVPDGDDGILVVVAAPDAQGDVAVEVARVGPGPSLRHPPFVAMTFPAPAPDWARDRYRHALDAALHPFTAGVDAAGRILLLWGGMESCGPGTLAGRWFHPDGTPRGPVFRAATALPPARAGGPGYHLFRLPDGSLGLRSDVGGEWVRRFADGALAGGPVPAWLAERAGVDLARVPIPGVVAALHPADAGGVSAVELLAAGGERCASLALPPRPIESWYDRDAGALRPAVTRDGSIVALQRADPGPAPAAGCEYRVWRRALR